MLGYIKVRMRCSDAGRLASNDQYVRKGRDLCDFFLDASKVGPDVGRPGRDGAKGRGHIDSERQFDTQALGRQCGMRNGAQGGLSLSRSRVWEDPDNILELA